MGQILLSNQKAVLSRSGEALTGLHQPESISSVLPLPPHVLKLDVFVGLSLRKSFYSGTSLGSAKWNFGLEKLQRESEWGTETWKWLLTL